ncbi:MAG: type II secretion system protein [Woeseiaceae bacterium]
MTNRSRHKPVLAKQRGLTLVEILVATLLLAILLVPALNSIQLGFLGADAHSDYSANHYRIVSRLETVLADTFSNLEAAVAGPSVPSSYSDAGGTPSRIVVYVAAYDADNADTDDDPFTGTDDGVLWVSVSVEGTAQNLVTLATRD